MYTISEENMHKKISIILHLGMYEININACKTVMEENKT